MSTKADEVFSQVSKSAGSSRSSAWMAGFFLLGILLDMPGSLVVAWRYHTDAEPKSIGFHFLALSVGFIVASQLLPRLLPGVSLRAAAISASALAFGSLLGLSLLSPPAAAAWRIGMLAVAGTAAGALTHSLFYGNQAWFESAPAASANRAGALFVGGALLATTVSGSTYFGGSLRIQTTLLSLVPAFYLLLLVRSRFQPLIRSQREDPLRKTLQNLRSVVTLLFSLLLFFQFACEWAIAGWLPLFLIHTLGINPATAIWMLALYFLALMLGRLAAQVLLPMVSHRKMLLLGMASAMAGYLLLSMAGSILPAMAATLIIGLGHAPIYPLIAERLDHRLSYHTRSYSGTISLVIAGATATPWLLACVDGSLGMPAVMTVPALASIAVLFLAILIMLEARLMGSKQDDSQPRLVASD